MRTEDNWLLPEGIDEVFPEEAERLEQLRRKIIDLFASWGYRLVMPPLIEFIESLLTGSGNDLDLQTFKIIDQISGRLMGIRADMTPQVARIDARNLGRDAPTRLCYIGTVLRTQSDHLEKSRSPLQVGAELYGHAGNASDLEVIRLMLEMLAIAGIQSVHLDLGHVGIYRELARQAGLDARQEAELFEILQRKDYPELAAQLRALTVSNSAAEMLKALIDLNGHEGVIEEARRRLAAANEPVHSALADLESIASGLSRLFPALRINFDLAELRGYHYKTGVVFAAFVPGYGREIARGGRYDEIGRIFGRARPATGFSADLKVLARLGSRPDDSLAGTRIFAPAVDDPDLHEKVRDLRSAGKTVIQELAGQIGGAREMACSHCLRKQGVNWEIFPVGD
ncbi:ATP phosphoribosyltransferase regulatory subunit [Methylocaldum szegediense]|uniref:ATP phosphoribosyltransferase regulatory subunit n=1 Tax=Methylocaldum szegediense TaxID=73780 RepID=A0ABM9HWS9_9GAMM|nr:ATP phosphoribosyltransferase regulatory subunit [Methylocaldum szegediense]CAI8728113.1 ATP phosphoribosyltransferase regulatory subunit [Methylocaldum szegediense]